MSTMKGKQPIVMCHECPIRYVCKVGDSDATSIAYGWQGFVQSPEREIKWKKAVEKVKLIVLTCPLLHGGEFSQIFKVK